MSMQSLKKIVIFPTLLLSREPCCFLGFYGVFMSLELLLLNFS